MKTFEAVIYVTNQICVTIEAEDEEEALQAIEDNMNDGKYDDMIAERVGSYSETHSVDIAEC